MISCKVEKSDKSNVLIPFGNDGLRLLDIEEEHVSISIRACAHLERLY